MTGRFELALAFAKTLHETLGRDIVAEVVRLNAQPGRGNECASHDFHDANMLMAEAFQRAVGRAPLMPSDVEEGNTPERDLEADVNLWNSAWFLAKSGEFSEVKILATASATPASIGQSVSTAWQDVLGTEFLQKPADGPVGRKTLDYLRSQEGRLMQLFHPESEDSLQVFAGLVATECARLEREGVVIEASKLRRPRP